MLEKEIVPVCEIFAAIFQLREKNNHLYNHQNEELGIHRNIEFILEMLLLGF